MPSSCRPTAKLVLLLGFTTTIGSQAASGQPSQSDSRFRLATFSADVTIPLGHRCMGVLPVKARRIVDPLEARGFVLLGGGDPIVFVAVDWCEIRNDAYQAWRSVLSKAAGTTEERVLVASIHQHDAPVVDLGAEALLAEVGLAGELCDVEFHAVCLARVASALRVGLERARPVTHLGIGRAKVERIASNWRIVREDGSVSYGRSSASGANLTLAEAPEGLIDPWLRTISFWDDQQALASLSSYAVHPMSFYGKGGVSADFVGAARRRRQQDTPTTVQIYASGCSGDTTAGKYNDGAAVNRAVLADRLYVAMRNAWETTEKHPLKSIEFRSVPLSLDFREGAAYTVDALRRTLVDRTAKVTDRILAAMALSSRARVARKQPIDVACLDLGVAQVVLLPGETFVGYQLMAQQMHPSSHVMCIGYGECWPGYIPTAAAVKDGFTDKWLWVAARSAEPKMHTALRDVLHSPER